MSIKQSNSYSIIYSFVITVLDYWYNNHYITILTITKRYKLNHILIRVLITSDSEHLLREYVKFNRLILMLHISIAKWLVVDGSFNCHRIFLYGFMLRIELLYGGSWLIFGHPRRNNWRDN